MYEFLQNSIRKSPIKLHIEILYKFPNESFHKCLRISFHKFLQESLRVTQGNSSGISTEKCSRNLSTSNSSWRSFNNSTRYFSRDSIIISTRNFIRNFTMNSAWSDTVSLAWKFLFSQEFYPIFSWNRSRNHPKNYFRDISAIMRKALMT